MTEPILLTMTFFVFPLMLVCFITYDWTVPSNHKIDCVFFNFDGFLVVIMIFQLKHGTHCEMKIIVINHTTMNNPIEIRFKKKRRKGYPYYHMLDYSF